MNNSSGLNIDKELTDAVVHLYVTTKTFLNLHRDLPVSQVELDLWNFFAVISRSLWNDIVVSIGRLILDKRNDVANIDWFIERLKNEGRLTTDEYSTFTKEVNQLKVQFEPFRKARNKVFAHKDVKVLEQGDPVLVDVDLDGIEKLVDSLWSLYIELSKKTRDTTVLPPIMGPAGLEE